MSASLLLKSLKLLEDQKTKSKGPKARGHHSKRKKNKKKKEEQSKEDIIKKNLRQLELLTSQLPAELSKQVFQDKNSDKIEITKVEERTVFTEKDFEDFEKEYFVS